MRRIKIADQHDKSDKTENHREYNAPEQPFVFSCIMAIVANQPARVVRRAAVVHMRATGMGVDGITFANHNVPLVAFTRWDRPPTIVAIKIGIMIHLLFPFH